MKRVKFEVLFFAEGFLLAKCNLRYSEVNSRKMKVQLSYLMPSLRNYSHFLTYFLITSQYVSKSSTTLNSYKLQHSFQVFFFRCCSLMQPGQHVPDIPKQRQKFLCKSGVHGVRDLKCEKKNYFLYILTSTVPQRIVGVHFNRAGSTSQTSSSKSIYKASDYSTPSSCSELIQSVPVIKT